MKKIIIALICVFCIVQLFIFDNVSAACNIAKCRNSTKCVDKRGFKLKKGDVIVVNGSFSNIMVWHAGIAVSDNMVLHINSLTKGVKKTPWNKWIKYYLYKSDKWMKVYRHKSYKVAKQAADWAKKKYMNKKHIRFVLSNDLRTTKETYCSKLVWQAYYYGPKKPSAVGGKRGWRPPHTLHKTIKKLYLCYVYRINRNGKIEKKILKTHNKSKKKRL